MTIKNPYNYLSSFKIVALVFLFALVSCKKEHTPLPYNKIEEFNLKIKDGSTLTASIVNQDIIVYWPPFQDAPESITPVIKTSEGSVISPASGEKVPFKDGTTYTVTAQDGSVKTYTLKTVINQPDFASFRVFEPEIFNNSNLIRLGTSIRIFSNDYLVQDLTKTRVTFIATDGKTYNMPISKLTPTDIESPVFTAENVPAIGTKFKIKVETGVKSYTGPDTYTIAPVGPHINSDLFTPRTLKGGDSFTITGVGDASYFTAAALSDENAEDFIPINITSKNGNSITFTIPANFPKGKYIFFQYSYKGDTYHAELIDDLFYMPAITITQ